MACMNDRAFEPAILEACNFAAYSRAIYRSGAQPWLDGRRSEGRHRIVQTDLVMVSMPPCRHAATCREVVRRLIRPAAEDARSLRKKAATKGVMM